MMKFISVAYAITFIIFITIIIIILPAAFAADSTPSADIQAQLDDLKKEIASKAAKLKQEVNKKLRDKAYIGKIKTKSPTALTLATKNGPKLVNINQDTLFESQITHPSSGGKTKSPTLKILVEEDYLAALGDVDETSVLTAKKVILLPTPSFELKTYLWGQVVAVSDKLVTIKDRSLKNIAISVPGSAKLNIGDFVILTGIIGKNDIFEADFVHVVPQGGILKPKKVATPSATR